VELEKEIVVKISESVLVRKKKIIIRMSGRLCTEITLVNLEHQHMLLRLQLSFSSLA
jgi:hypothetical protein